MARYYSERAICEIVWLVASEHVYNMTNIGLNIHSDMLCVLSKKKSGSRGVRVCFDAVLPDGPTRRSSKKGV